MVFNRLKQCYNGVSNLKGETLEEFANRLRQGDISALEPIYNETRKAVFTIIFNIVRNYAESEDLMQETYVKVCRKIDTYKSGTNFKQWIFTIAKNMALNSYNHTKKVILTDFASDEGKNLGNNDEMIIGDESGIIKFALTNLEKNEGNIVLLHTVGGLKLSEIADILEKPKGTVRWQYNNALNKLKKLIREGKYVL